MPTWTGTLPYEVTDMSDEQLVSVDTRVSDEQLAPVDTHQPHRWGRARLLAGAALLAVLVGTGLAAGTFPRLLRDRAVREQAAATAAQPRRVAAATATRVTPDAERVSRGTPSRSPRFPSTPEQPAT